MQEYLIYFHFRLMHYWFVPRLVIPASRWDWHLPENGRNCSGWSSFQFCVVSNPLSLFTTTIVLPSHSVATSPSSKFGQIWKFPNFLMTPLFWVISIIDVQIFNSTQNDKISKNQTQSLMAFGKIISSLMWLRNWWFYIKSTFNDRRIWSFGTPKLVLTNLKFGSFFRLFLQHTLLERSLTPLFYPKTDFLGTELQPGKVASSSIFEQSLM